MRCMSSSGSVYNNSVYNKIRDFPEAVRLYSGCYVAGSHQFAWVTLSMPCYSSMRMSTQSICTHDDHLRTPSAVNLLSAMIPVLIDSMMIRYVRRYVDWSVVCKCGGGEHWRKPGAHGKRMYKPATVCVED